MQLCCAEICGKYCLCGKDYDAVVKDEQQRVFLQQKEDVWKHLLFTDVCSCVYVSLSVTVSVYL